MCWTFDKTATHRDDAFGGTYPADQWRSNEDSDVRLLVFPDNTWLTYRGAEMLDGGNKNPPRSFSL